MIGKAEQLKFTKRVKPRNERDRKQEERKKTQRQRKASRRSRVQAYEHWDSHIRHKPSNKPREFS